MSMTREERLEAAKARTQNNIGSKDSFGVKGKKVLDYSKIGGWNKDLFYVAKDGMNHLDIIPYIVNHPEKTQSPNFKPGTPDYVLDLFVHRFVGASKSDYLCLNAMYGKPCPICEERERVKNDPLEPEDAYKALFAKRRTIYNVINTDSTNKNQPVQLFEEPHFWFEKPLLEVVAVKNVFAFFDIEDGKNIEFMLKTTKTSKGNSKDYGQFYFTDREPYTEAIYKEAYPLDELLIVPTYDEVLAAMLSIDESELEKEEAPKETESRRAPVTSEAPTLTSGGARARGQVTTVPEEVSAPEGDPFNDDAVPEVVPARTRTRTRTEPEVENPCPFGHVFGQDNEKFLKEGHCNNCDEKIWNACGDAHDALMKGK